jgi:hypothetical protein
MKIKFKLQEARNSLSSTQIGDHPGTPCVAVLKTDSIVHHKLNELRGEGKVL